MPHMKPTHKPGTIPVTKVADRPAVRSSSDSPTSFSEAVTEPTESFPSLAPPQEQGKHLSQTPVYARDTTPRKVTQSPPTKTGASDSVDTTKGESQVSPTQGSSHTTPPEPTDGVNELPLLAHSFGLYAQARGPATAGGLNDPLVLAHDWLSRETEVTADRLSTRATERTEPGDKDTQVL